jgi:hypothetical protein
MAATESVWGLEMGWGFQRAVTTYVQEAGCCATGSAAEVALFAWDDGVDWEDENGPIGWADWPPVSLEAVAAASD